MVAAAIAVMCTYACQLEDKSSSPQFISATISEGDVATIDLSKIEASYSSQITILDSSKITLTKDGGSNVDLSFSVNNITLTITLCETLEYDSQYTLNFGYGALAAKSNNKSIVDNHTINFESESDPLANEPDYEFKITETLITPNATTQAQALYDYLREGFGSRTLSGAMCKYTVQATEAEWMAEQSGKYPAILCYDFMNVTRSWSWDEPYSTMITTAKEWHDNGGIIAAMWHWRDPLRETDAFYSMNMSSDVSRTSFDISKIDDASSDEYKAMVADIDVVADYLLQLQDLGIPVLWRPLHEAQGAWFWWGAGSADNCKTLWCLLYERLVEYHNINNLIWVWTVDMKNGASSWYPGDEKVDILGTDIYSITTHDSRREYFDFVAEIGSYTKLVALSECGAIPHPDNMVKYGDTWAWFMPWVGDYTQSDTYNGASFFNTILNSDFVITRDEVKY